MVKAVPRTAHSALPEISAGPRDHRLAQLERAENFPVALRLLPSTVRDHLRAVYDIARVIDDTGDEGEGDRSADLIALRTQIARIWSAQPPTSGLLGRLAATVRVRGIQPEPFERLIEANLHDQRVARYPRRSDLLAYCTLSADPIGRLVLAVFGATSPENIALSDRICTGLQILEHCQDVGEDYRRGRIYLPQQDLSRYDVEEVEFGAIRASPGLRHVVRTSAQTANDLLTEGRPLIGRLRGTARLAVAGYLAGGLATFDALRRADWQVLPAGPRPRRQDVARHAGRLLAEVSLPARPGLPDRTGRR
jgi:squalene synthase HpnC